MAKYQKPFAAVEPSIHNRGPAKYIETLEERRQAMLRAVPYVIAMDVLNGIRSRLPNTTEYRAYRESLKIAEIKGMKEGKFGGFSIFADSKARRVKKVDRSKTVIYIRAKETRMDRPPEDVKILEDYGPWTVDTLPFWPDN